VIDEGEEEGTPDPIAAASDPLFGKLFNPLFRASSAKGDPYTTPSFTATPSFARKGEVVRRGKPCELLKEVLSPVALLRRGRR